MRRLALASVLAVLAIGASAQGPRDPADPAGVKALDTRGSTPAPCGPVGTSDGFVSGGCEAVAHDFDVKLSIRTVFGAMSFGSCSTTFDVNLAADGRIWLDRIRTGGFEPCSDIQPCAPAAILAKQDDPYDRTPLAKVFPWTGRMLGGRDGRYSGHVDMCFDTCVGRYEGRVAIGLVRERRQWVMTAADAGVGAGGLSIDGRWELDREAFELRTPDQG